MARTQRQAQGDTSRALILDTTERLMGSNGYAATSISEICKASGLPASSVYWHFGSKEGVLAAVMERGAERFFAAIPQRDEAAKDGVAQQFAETARLLSQHPDFLRLFYLLSLERSDDPGVTTLVRRVRDTAIAGFRNAIAGLLPVDVPVSTADGGVLDELTALAVALSDGIFIADHLEPGSTDVERMYRRLFQAVTALLPILLEER